MVDKYDEVKCVGVSPGSQVGSVFGPDYSEEIEIGAKCWSVVIYGKDEGGVWEVCSVQTTQFESEVWVMAILECGDGTKCCCSVGGGRDRSCDNVVHVVHVVHVRDSVSG